jgi:putative transposase
MMVSCKGAHLAKEIIRTCMRWHLVYLLSYRQLEEMMQERGIAVYHLTVNRRILKYAPQLTEALHRRKRPVSRSWRLAETYIRVRGHWCYLYRAMERQARPAIFSCPPNATERQPYGF